MWKNNKNMEQLPEFNLTDDCVPSTACFMLVALEQLHCKKRKGGNKENLLPSLAMNLISDKVEASSLAGLKADTMWYQLVKN